MLHFYEETPHATNSTLAPNKRLNNVDNGDSYYAATKEEGANALCTNITHALWSKTLTPIIRCSRGAFGAYRLKKM